MLYVDNYNLNSGMILGRALNFYNELESQSVSYKAGTKITDEMIAIIKANNISQIIIDEKKSMYKHKSVIDNDLKDEAITSLKNLANAYSTDGVTVSMVDDVGNVAKELITNIEWQKDLMINIADIKMYDDYTFHHSLSVSIMALAIGIEMGLTSFQLNELVICGLLHDIGKVSVPIEIINKPGRLTDEEFQIVKMHPVLAGEHLKERKLVSNNIYEGIIGHHEKMDGSGYPKGLKNNQIHIYSRIIAVADVYDALTSQRSYRTPSPSSEAVEYIMGGTGSHFDETVVRAFLRKIAPYPVGAVVGLSNGEQAQVISNFSEQPLRPIVSVLDSIKVYDLYRDSNTYNIVITGITSFDIPKKKEMFTKIN